MAGLRHGGDDERLDPVRRRGPRPRSLLRHTVAAALLALAAAVLLVAPASSSSSDCRGASTPGSGSANVPPAGSARPAAGSHGAKGRDELGGSARDPRSTGAAEPLPVPPGKVGVPIQLAEPATAGVTRPGDRVDVIARTERPAPDDPPRESATSDVVLATAALVLAVNSHPEGSPDEGVVYLAMTQGQARQVANTAPDVALGITVRPR